MPRESEQKLTYATGFRQQWPEGMVLKDSAAGVLVSITRESEYTTNQIPAVVSLLLRQGVGEIVFIVAGSLQRPWEQYRRRQLKATDVDYLSSANMQGEVAKVRAHIEGMFRWAKEVDAAVAPKLLVDALSGQADAYGLLSNDDQLLRGLRAKEDAFEKKVYEVLAERGYPSALWDASGQDIIRCSPWEEYQGNPRSDHKARYRFVRFLQALKTVKATYDRDKTYSDGVNDVVRKFAFKEYRGLLDREIGDLDKQEKVEGDAEKKICLQQNVVRMRTTSFELSKVRHPYVVDDLSGFEKGVSLPFTYSDLILFSQYYVLSELGYQLVLAGRHRARPFSALVYPGKEPTSFAQNHRALIAPLEGAGKGWSSCLMRWLGLGFLKEGAVPTGPVRSRKQYGSDERYGEDFELKAKVESLLQVEERGGDRMLRRQRSGSGSGSSGDEEKAPERRVAAAPGGGVGSPSDADPVTEAEVLRANELYRIIHVLRGNGNGGGGISRKVAAAGPSEKRLAQRPPRGSSHDSVAQPDARSAVALAGGGGHFQLVAGGGGAEDAAAELPASLPEARDSTAAGSAAVRLTRSVSAGPILGGGGGS